MNSDVKIDLPFSFSEKKTYLVLIKSRDSNIDIEGNAVNVKAINIVTNIYKGTVFSGGPAFDPINFQLSFAVTFPVKKGGALGLYIRRPSSTSVATVFDVVIYEL